MKKTYKVRNHKKAEHIYTLCADVAEYLDVLAAHDASTMFVWKEKSERREITYLDFVEAVRALGLGLEEIFGKSTEEHPVRIAVIGESSPKWFAAYLAIMAAGYTVVPMDKELAVSEIGGFLKFAGISGVVYSASFAAAFTDSVEDISMVRICRRSGYSCFSASSASDGRRMEANTQSPFSR